MKPALFCGWCLGLLSCAAVHRAPTAEQVPAGGSGAKRPGSDASSGAARPATSLASASPRPIAPAPLDPASASPPLKLTETQLLSVPVSAIALGEGTRIAVLADIPYVGDARSLRPLPLPALLRPKSDEVDQLGIFFGRDNEPRIMGSRRGPQGERAVYLRHLQSGWRDGREELGQLGGPAPGGLWGVLGSADPELVCRTDAICIIKRTSGWTRVPAGHVARIVTLQDGALWGLDETGISGIDARGWQLAIAAPAWSEPQAFWATRGEAWVSTARELFHYTEGKWQTVPSPVGHVTSVWGTRPDSVWVVGSEGAAHFDGRSFRPLAGVRGPLRVVRGRSDSELWLAGDEGLIFAIPAAGGNP